MNNQQIKHTQRFEEEIISLTAQKKQLQKEFDVVSTLRLLDMIAALGCLAASLFLWLPPLAFLSLFLLLVFVVLVVRHANIEENIRRVTCLLEVNRQYIGRQTGAWRSFKDTGADFLQENHPYASDLDIFGSGSLFQYLSCTHTFYGRRHLAGLLAQPDAAVEAIGYRQAAVRELADAPAFCKKYQSEAMLWGEVSEAPTRLLKYATNKEKLYKTSIPQIGMLVLSGIFIGTAILATTKIVPAFLPLALGVALVVLTAIGLRYKHILNNVAGLKHSLEAYRGLLETAFVQEFSAPGLQDVYATLFAGTAKSREGLKKLDNIMGAVEFRSSGVLYFIVNIIFLWDYHCIFALERWKARYGEQVESWLEALGTLESYCSLAVLPQVRQDVDFPTITKTPVQCRGEALLHPLIDPAVVVANPVDVSNSIFIITGSNMSGKTTLLRTVGINLVLAYAGAPVAAQNFECSVMSLYTSMRNMDNLEGGISTFYAELLRIKMIVEFAKKEVPMLFLLDELFKGTNSQDRVVGAKAVLQNLNKAWCIGMVSTHDFELCDIAESSAGRIHNYHFTEHYVEDDIQFDYVMRTGRCSTTNARHLMRLAGVQLEE